MNAMNKMSKQTRRMILRQIAADPKAHWFLTSIFWKKADGSLMQISTGWSTCVGVALAPHEELTHYQCERSTKLANMLLARLPTI